MAISNNPTKTRGIEKAWNREIDQRFAEFQKSVIGELRALNQLTVNEFAVNPDQLRAYMNFFQQKLDALITGTWQSKHQSRSYQLAIDRFNEELKRLGSSIGIGEVDFISLIPQKSLSNVVHQEALDFLSTRSFESLSGISQDMARNIRSVLFDGANQGFGINKIVKNMLEKVDISKSRARMIARTETIQAFQRGTINQAAITSDILGEEVKLRWLTRRDNKVRQTHASWHGKIFTQDNAFKNINISPWNCRCGLSPVIDEADTEAKRVKFSKERKQLKALTKP